jgi:hypothetical protein
MYDMMSLLKPLRNTNLLIPYEKFYILFLHQAGKLISEQYPGDPNPLLQLDIRPMGHSRL